LGDSGREVKLLQRKLQRLGYYKKEITGVYDLNTLAAVFALQLEHGIVTRDDDPNLHGYF
jgi:peptidoglycan hydrolase-like protein with peptidoglycan-binding domain